MEISSSGQLTQRRISPSLIPQVQFFNENNQQVEEVENSDSDTEEPSPEALARYLAMRRHTVGVGDNRMTQAQEYCHLGGAFINHIPQGFSPAICEPSYLVNANGKLIVVFFII